MRRQPRIAVVPDSRPAMHAAFTEAVRSAGGVIVAPEDAEAIVWADPARAEDLPSVVGRSAGVRWVQLPYAGIEPFIEHLDRERVWTCGKGVYAKPVAEHALALALAGMRGLGTYSRADRWREPIGRNLLGAQVTVIGGGGICTELLGLLAPFDCQVTVVRNRPRPSARATVVGPAGMLEAVAAADLVVLALPLTPVTVGLVDAPFLAAMQSHAWLVNVARGAHVVTADLLAALRAGAIGGAALDVTDPEPLPDGHPLFAIESCIVTPHVANTPEMGLPLIAARVRGNVERFASGAPLEGLVDVDLGY
jgi:phosphoglycerate dehydrogenase-like enzyme